MSDWTSLSSLMPGIAVRMARTGNIPGLIPVWERGVGEQIARNATPTRLIEETLWIRARSPQWEQELRAREKDILQKLAQILGPGVVVQLAFESI
jgi:predicted nucleic acid-binding Zn ribbon protein